ncbi:hypothetical protein [Nostoc sp.]|uniref:hypothetical protein n=1 Tax=Nostoc sp. TaxID=1180 RepID=UPI002FF524E2
MQCLLLTSCLSIKIISDTVVTVSQLLLSRIISATQHKRSWTAKQLKSLAEFSFGQLRSIDFLRSPKKQKALFPKLKLFSKLKI